MGVPCGAALRLATLSGGGGGFDWLGRRRHPRIGGTRRRRPLRLVGRAQPVSSPHPHPSSASAQARTLLSVRRSELELELELGSPEPPPSRPDGAMLGRRPVPAPAPGYRTPATGSCTPADRAPTAVPTDQSPLAVPTDHAPLAVPTDHAPLAVPTDHAPLAVPTDHAPLAVPTDHAPPVPTDHAPLGMPADHSPPVPTDHFPLAMPADHAPPVPTDHAPLAMPADHSPPVPTDHFPLAMPADHSPAVPADQAALAVPADHSPPAAPADQAPAAPGAQPSPQRRSPAPDAASLAADAVSLYGQVDSVSMYGTAESLLPEDGSSMGSDSEINGSTASSRRTDKYGFLGGAQFCGGRESAIPLDVARQRELKWLEMLGRWDKWVARRFDKVKLRCRKGIPSSLRARAWQQLSQSKQLMEQNLGKFEELDRQLGDPKWLDVIEKDLHRQFPFHEMFALRGGHGQQDLYRILKAYTIYRPEEGYCQAQAPVAAVLLMHMPAEQAFWCLVQICEKYLPGYYSAGLEAIQLDGEIFFSLLRRVSPLAHRHLKKFKIDPILYMTEWFMCIYSRTLPWSSVLRVWDMFFCDGVKVIFKVGLVLLRHTLGSVDKLRDCQGMYETMEKLRSIPAQYLQEDFLVHEVVSLKVTEALIERENKTQRQRWLERRGELQHRPSRRLYGARAIREELAHLNPLLSSSPSLLSLWRGKDERRQRGPSPTHSVSSLVFSAGPRPQAQPAGSSSPTLSQRGRQRPQPAVAPPPQPGPVVSEGLQTSLPSPTSSVAAFGEPKPTKEERKREKDLERQREKERARAEKERARAEKERARAEKERERRMLKAQNRKQKGAKKENGASEGALAPATAAEPSNSASVLKDGYF